MLAHGAVLCKQFFSTEELIAIVVDYRNAGLSDEEVALMAFAQRVILDPGEIEEGDFQALRGFDLQDEEIFDVVLVATARSFFSKTVDSLGVVPDDIYKDLEPELLKVLAVGRPYP